MGRACSIHKKDVHIRLRKEALKEAAITETWSYM
jgi:hypothetical protein